MARASEEDWGEGECHLLVASLEGGDLIGSTSRKPTQNIAPNTARKPTRIAMKNSTK